MKNELLTALGLGRGGFLAIAVFSVFVNLLMLTGPLFMLQVYDRVLASRSEATLVALLGLVIALYAFMGVLDYARGRVAARIGANFQTNLDERVFQLGLDRVVVAREMGAARGTLRDVESVQRFLASPTVFAIFDLPWTPIFLLVIFVFHPLMGWFAVCGTLVLVALTFANQMLTRKRNLAANRLSTESEAFAAQVHAQGETVAGLGMQSSVLERWRSGRDRALDERIAVADRTGAFASASKSLRFLLQSAILAIGAWLVLRGQLTPGAMIAGSILLGRALAPVDQAISGWSAFQSARSGWKNLGRILERLPPRPRLTALPRPEPRIEADRVSVFPPGTRTPTLISVSFDIQPGTALGVIGNSGSGKSTLARALSGMWPVASGTIRLGGAPIEQYSSDDLCRYIGYLPQEVAVFEATVAENIARLAVVPDDEEVVRAAKAANAHDMIVDLPKGYDTMIDPSGTLLSGGQRQRIGLARALYGNPEVLILDEPNSNLDNAGQRALNAAVRVMKDDGKAVVIMAHRPAAIIECETLLILDKGAAKAYGPRDEVLKAHVKNYTHLATTMAKEATG